MIDPLGNNYLFILLLISGFILANIPSWIIKDQNKSAMEVSDSKSIFAFSTFQKK